VLIPRTILERMARGEVTLAFRRWIRPTVEAGATLRTACGVLHVVAVERVSERALTEAEARRAGHGSRAELLRALARGRPGWLYRIELRPGAGRTRGGS
jgi:hypothetical protein